MSMASSTAGVCKEAATDAGIRALLRMLLTGALLLLMLLCSFDYLPGVLVPAAGESAGKTPGYRSDLYPPWLASREFLLHGRNPYSSEVTREIQRGIYGKAIARPGAGPAIDEQRFAYPLFTTFLLLPIVAIPFSVVQPLAAIAVFVFALCSLILWRNCWDLPLRTSGQLFWIGLLLVWIPVVQGVWLQQLGLLVCLLLAACIWFLTKERLVLSGILLAIAGIKPQLALPVAVFLAFWVAGDLRRRYKLALSAAVAILILLLSSEALQPGWISEWLGMLREYRRYTQAQSFMEILTGNNASALAVSAALWILTAFVCFSLRAAAPRSRGFAAGLCLAICTGILTSPNWQMHNQAVLLSAGTWLFLSEANSLGGPRRVPVLACKTAVLWYAATVTIIVIAQLWGWHISNRDVLTLPLASTFFAPPLFFAATLFSAFHVIRGREACAASASIAEKRSYAG